MIAAKLAEITVHPVRWFRTGAEAHAGTSRGLWLGPVAFSLALAGTLTLPDAGARLFSDTAIILGGLLAVFAWGGPVQTEPPDARTVAKPLPQWFYENPWRVEGFAISLLVAIQADVLFIKNPDNPFGLAGVLWLLGIVALLTITSSWTIHPSLSGTTHAIQRLSHSRCAEIAIVVAIAAVAAILRLWNLAGIPFAIHPDEIITGHVALQSYAGPKKVSIFLTQWKLVNLPALWFASVAASLTIFGHTLTALRLPNAVFGTAAIIPFYAMVRYAWGQVAAIAGAWILAVSAVDVHFSRVTVNNLVPVFFWATCFFFLLRGVSGRRAIDWCLAGIAAGLSEYTFYGTRLLAPILLCFCVYLALIHKWRDLQSLFHFGILVVGYVVAFGPLLAYFVQNPTMYFGRGQDELIWHHWPRNLSDALSMGTALWPPISDNLLGINTQADRGSFYFAPLLMPAEAGLLVLGAAILFWRWRQPAEFLIMLSGLGTLFVGGTLVVGAPSLQHWTPAFPAIFAAMAVPIGAWAKSMVSLGSRKLRLGCALLLAFGLSAIAVMNINFYFRDYRVTRPEFELRAAQSRWEAGIGVKYRVFTVGVTWQPYDAETNSYLIQGQEGKTLLHPTVELPVPTERGRGLGFVFMNDETKYISLVKRVYPGGKAGEVRSRGGIHLFYTYLVPPP